MAKVMILGGGLSGLYAALLLEQRGVDYLLLESRDRLGGRILSADVSIQHDETSSQHASVARVDLGATWYWPAMQPQVDAVVRELGLRAFEQHEDGDMLIDRSAHRSATRVSGFRTTPPSMRLEYGMASLVEAIAERIHPSQILLQTRAESLAASESEIRIVALDLHGKQVFFEASQVLLAVPPRLAASSIRFDPPQPDSLQGRWLDTATWMAPHAKYIATYPTPFWRQAGLSGEAQSTVGPMAEIHDASTETIGALFGFLGITAEIRFQVTDDELRTLCRAQLVRLFGPAAASPEIEFLKDWTRDPWTATEADRHAGLHLSTAPVPSASGGPWNKRLYGIASEWSPMFPGYVAGALDAASRGVTALLESL